MADIRKIKLLRSNRKYYYEIPEQHVIGDINTIELIESLPTVDEVNILDNPSRYIKISDGNETYKYYELLGKKPNEELLDYGEIAVSYGKDTEGIIFKNSNNELVEINPNIRGKVYEILSTLDSEKTGSSENDTIQVIVKQEDGKISDIEVIDNITPAYQEYIENKISFLDTTISGTNNNGTIGITITQTDGLIKDITIEDDLSDTIVEQFNSLNSSVSNTSESGFITVTVEQEKGKLSNITVSDTITSVIEEINESIDNITPAYQEYVTTTINDLDSEKTGSSENDTIQVVVEQIDGKISNIEVIDNITPAYQEYVTTTINDLDSEITATSQSGTVTANIQQVNGVIDNLTVDLVKLFNVNNGIVNIPTTTVQQSLEDDTPNDIKIISNVKVDEYGRLLEIEYTEIDEMYDAGEF